MMGKHYFPYICQQMSLTRLFPKLIRFLKHGDRLHVEEISHYKGSRRRKNEGKKERKKGRKKERKVMVMVITTTNIYSTLITLSGPILVTLQMVTHFILTALWDEGSTFISLNFSTFWGFFVANAKGMHALRSKSNRTEAAQS